MVTLVYMHFSYVLFQKHRPRLMQDRAGGLEEDLKEGDVDMDTTARLDICTGTAICSGLRSEWGANPQQDKQGTANLPQCHNLLLPDKLIYLTEDLKEILHTYMCFLSCKVDEIAVL